MNTTKRSQTETARFLNFSLGKEQFTIPLLAVQEVIAIPSITALPDAPPYFLGIMNLRGRIISVVDLSAKMKATQARERSAETAVIILDLADSVSLGILVDSVNSVLTVDSANISPCPELGDGTKAYYLSGVARTNDQMYLMLDVEKVFQADEEQIQKIALQKEESGSAQSQAA